MLLIITITYLNKDIIGIRYKCAGATLTDITHNMNGLKKHKTESLRLAKLDVVQSNAFAQHSIFAQTYSSTPSNPTQI